VETCTPKYILNPNSDLNQAKGKQSHRPGVKHTRINDYIGLFSSDCLANAQITAEHTRILLIAGILPCTDLQIDHVLLDCSIAYVKLSNKGYIQ